MNPSRLRGKTRASSPVSHSTEAKERPVSHGPRRRFMSQPPCRLASRPWPSPCEWRRIRNWLYSAADRSAARCANHENSCFLVGFGWFSARGHLRSCAEGCRRQLYSTADRVAARFPNTQNIAPCWFWMVLLAWVSPIVCRYILTPGFSLAANSRRRTARVFK